MDPSEETEESALENAAEMSLEAHLERTLTPPRSFLCGTVRLAQRDGNIFGHLAKVYLAVMSVPVRERSWKLRLRSVWGPFAVCGMDRHQRPSNIRSIDADSAGTLSVSLVLLLHPTVEELEHSCTGNCLEIGTRLHWDW